MRPEPPRRLTTLSAYAISRATGLPVSPLLTQAPKTLAKNQRQARHQIEKARREYAEQPSFGAEVDIDVATYDPEVLDPSTSVRERHSIALGILDKVEPR